MKDSCLFFFNWIAALAPTRLGHGNINWDNWGANEYPMTNIRGIPNKP